MNKLIIGAVCSLAVLGVGCEVISFGNDCARMEASIEAQYKQNQNNYSSYFMTIKEMAQVPEMYSADLQKVYEGAIKGRYGSDGSKAVFQFIQEHNPNFDSSMYSRLQQAMQSGRARFESEQKMLLDKKRTYEEMLVTFPGSAVNSFLGYPKKDIASMDIVIDDRTAEDFATKRSTPISLKKD